MPVKHWPMPLVKHTHTYFTKQTDFHLTCSLLVYWQTRDNARVTIKARGPLVFKLDVVMSFLIDKCCFSLILLKAKTLTLHFESN